MHIIKDFPQNPFNMRSGVDLRCDTWDLCVARVTDQATEITPEELEWVVSGLKKLFVEYKELQEVMPPIIDKLKALTGGE